MSDLAQILKETEQAPVAQETDGVCSYVASEDGKVITGTIQDCTAILEDAQARHNAGMTGSSDMRHAARYPLAIVEIYCNTNGITLSEWSKNPEHMRRMLSDPDLKGFRIWDGTSVYH